MKKKDNEDRYDVYEDSDIEFLNGEGEFCNVESEKKVLHISEVVFFVIVVLAIMFCIWVNIRPQKIITAKEKKMSVKEEINSMKDWPESVPKEYVQKQKKLKEQYAKNVEPVDANSPYHYGLSSYVIDGYDFIQFNAGEVGLREVFDDLDYTEARLLAFTFENGITDVLKDMDKYVLMEDHYMFYIYTPENKPIYDISAEGSVILQKNVSHESGQRVEIYFFTLDDYFFKNTPMPVKVNISYADGTTETLTVSISKLKEERYVQL